MKTTTMSDAFDRAGYRDVERRLRDMMSEAIRRGDRKFDAARDYFVAELARRNDPALLWQLFEPVRTQRIREFFTEVLRTTAAPTHTESGQNNLSSQEARRSISDSVSPTEPGHRLRSSQEAITRVPGSVVPHDESGYAHVSSQEARCGFPDSSPPTEPGHGTRSSQEADSGLPGSVVPHDESGQLHRSSQEAKEILPDSSPPRDGAGHVLASSQEEAIKPVPAPPRPSRVSYMGVMRAAMAQRISLRNFRLGDLGDHGPVILGTMRLSAIEQRMRTLGKLAWTATAEYNLLERISKHAASYPPDTVVRDVIDDDALNRFYVEAVVTTEAPTFAIPAALAEVAHRS